MSRWTEAQRLPLKGDPVAAAAAIREQRKARTAQREAEYAAGEAGKRLFELLPSYNEQEREVWLAGFEAAEGSLAKANEIAEGALAERNKLRSEIITLKSVLASVEWHQPIHNGQPRCPSCDQTQDEGHATDCELAIALREVAAHVAPEPPPT